MVFAHALRVPSVTLNKEAVRKGYTLRDISVQRAGAKGKRRLFQLQFTAWPDHGTFAAAPHCDGKDAAASWVWLGGG